MPSYYKYAERQAASVIDWNKISSSLVDTLKEENTRREKLKAEIDKNSFEFGQDLNNAPQGDYTNANTWILNAADQGQQARLMQDNLLKSGQLKLKDYMVMRRNLEGDFKNMFAVSKEYQEEYKSKMERYRTNQSSTSELELMETIESLANFTKTSPYINPTSGVISLSKQELKDGVYKPTGDYVSIQALRNRLKINIDKFNEDNLSSDVKTLGETTISNIRRIDGLRRIIAVEKTKDPTLRKALQDDPEIGTYLDWEDAKVGEYLANPYTSLSILTDYVGKNEKGEKFKLTFNEEEFNNDKTGRLYLMKDDGSGVLKPTFKKEQEEMISKEIKNKYRNMIDREATIDVATEPDIYRPSVGEMEYYSGKKEEKEKMREKLNMLGQLYYGDNNQVKAASTYFRDLVPSVQGIKRGETGIVITFDDGKKRTLPFKDANGNVMSQADFIKSAVALHGTSNINQALRESGYDASKSFNPFSKGEAAVIAAPTKTVKNLDKFDKILQTKNNSYAEFITSSMDDEPEEIASAMASRFGPLGFTFTGRTEGLSDDKVDIKYNNIIIGTVDADNASGAASEIDAIMRNKLQESDTAAEAAAKAKENEQEDNLIGSLDD